MTILEIKDLKAIENNNKVTVTAFVDGLTPVSRFKRENGEKTYNSQRAAVMLCDGAGEKMEFMLWGNAVRHLSVLSHCLRNGEKIIVKNVIIRENNWKGNVVRKLHYTKGTEIVVTDILDKKLRKDKVITDLSQSVLQKYHKQNIDIIGYVKRIFYRKEFTRIDGSVGSIQNFTLVDSNNNELYCSVWDDKFDLKIPIGSKIYLSNFRVDAKANINQEELYRVSATYFSYLDLLTDITDITYLTVSAIQEGKENKLVNFLGIVGSIGHLQTFARDDGTEGKMRRVKLFDETGQIIFLTLWDEYAESFDYDIDSRILFINVRCKTYNNKKQLHTVSYTMLVTRGNENNGNKTTRLIVDEENNMTVGKINIEFEDQLMNALKGLLIILFNNCLVMNGVQEIRDEVFYSWVNSFMVKQNSLKEIDMSLMKKTVSMLIHEKKIVEKDGYLKWF